MSSWRKRSSAAASLEAAAHQLTERDRAIIAALAEFRLFTLEQLCRLFFTSMSAARDRLSTLFERGFLARSRPSTRAAYRYYLGPLGLRLLHADRVAAYEQSSVDDYGNRAVPNPGRAPTAAKAREYGEGVFLSSQRPHREGVSDFYSRLVASTRAHPETRLIQWEIETSQHRWWTALSLRPDGIFDLDIAGLVRPFWFEFDTGTETIDRLVEKVRRWNSFIERHLKMSWTLPLMLIELTKPGREDNLHAWLELLGTVQGVATTVTARSADPLGPVWRVCGDRPDSLRPLAEIPPPNR
ncbi:replication-relaxation family protein [Glycomyces terrestris]|uniref:Uncharacterized protein n=1 Tax=Glycomyces terrestris TaxID=2493553 RepID=A0A426UVE0_9ACTN|nr:replication-relaxation family protein [Glycomyces terrestris]RRR98213.1 hypothetical protein EIW28_14945 [Glycomyces terrestris]